MSLQGSVTASYCRLRRNSHRHDRLTHVRHYGPTIGVLIDRHRGAGAGAHAAEIRGECH